MSKRIEIKLLTEEEGEERGGEKEGGEINNIPSYTVFFICFIILKMIHDTYLS